MNQTIDNNQIPELKPDNYDPVSHAQSPPPSEVQQTNIEHSNDFEAPTDEVRSFSEAIDEEHSQENLFVTKSPKHGISQPLTADERETFHACEKSIREGLGTFVEVGLALSKVRDARLYREIHSTFENYVQGILGLSRPRAYDLIDSALVMQDLSAIADIPLPQNEAQARELRRLKSPEERQDKWKKIVAAAANFVPITAKFIRQFVQPSPPQPELKDKVRKIRRYLNALRALFEGSIAQDQASEVIDQLEEITGDVELLPTVFDPTGNEFCSQPSRVEPEPEPEPENPKADE